VLELFGDVIAWRVAAVVPSQSGHRLPALTEDEVRALATTPTEASLALPMLDGDDQRTASSVRSCHSGRASQAA